MEDLPIEAESLRAGWKFRDRYAQRRASRSSTSTAICHPARAAGAMSFIYGAVIIGRRHRRFGARKKLAGTGLGD